MLLKLLVQRVLSYYTDEWPDIQYIYSSLLFCILNHILPVPVPYVCKHTLHQDEDEKCISRGTNSIGFIIYTEKIRFFI